MKKVLVIIPNSIGGEKIMIGFAQGFKSNGCYVLKKDVQELEIEDIKKFQPDIIFGYDYSFLYSDNNELKDYIKTKQNEIKLIHYFADVPNEKFAYINKPELYEEFKKIKAISYIWDETYTSTLPNCKYLPMAINYKSYRTEEDKKYQITFVGRPLLDKRQEIIAALIKKFGLKVNIFSYEKHFLQSVEEMKTKQLLNEYELEIYKNAYRGYLETEQELANVFYNSNININVTIQGETGLNHRVFAVLASKGFLLTDETQDIHRYFNNSKELEVYKNIDDLLDKVAFYLKNKEIAQKIGLWGFAKVAKSHNYTARVNKILSDIK